MISANSFAQSAWSISPTGDVYNTNSGDVGIGTTDPDARLHIKGIGPFGLIIQNHEPVFHESGFMVREPLSDTGNRFSIIVGSGPASGIELAAIRDADGTGRTMDINTGAWRWKYGGATYMAFDANGVAAFGTTASTAAGKQVEIRASVPWDDALRIQGIWRQDGKLLRLVSDAGTELFNVSNNGNIGIGTRNPTATLHVNGNFVATGSKSAVVETASYGNRLMYAVESPENWFEDFGGGQLTYGQAVVGIEEIFSQTVNTDMNYHVFLTPSGPCTLYVAEKTPNHFRVKLLSGAADCKFDYRIIAKRTGYEKARLEEASTTQAK
jgi:hypothetical protein